MSCTIMDLVVSLSPDNSPIPDVGAKVIVGPTQRPIFVLIDSVLRELPDPSRTIIVDNEGQYTVVLPWPSEQEPQVAQWSIFLPDGTTWVGTVPEGISGPLTLHDLKDIYGWGLSTGPYPTKLIPVPIVGPRGLTGALGFTYRGVYSELMAYVSTDVVTFTNVGITNEYVCISSTTGNDPTNVTYWTLFLSGAAMGIPVPVDPDDNGKIPFAAGGGYELDIPPWAIRSTDSSKVKTIGTANSLGTETTVSPIDHIHAELPGGFWTIDGTLHSTGFTAVVGSVHLYNAGSYTITLPNPSTIQGRSIILKEMSGATGTGHANSPFGNFDSGSANDSLNTPNSWRMYTAAKDPNGDPGWIRSDVLPSFARLDVSQSFTAEQTFIPAGGNPGVNVSGNMSITGDPIPGAALVNTQPALTGSHVKHSPSQEYQGEGWNGSASKTVVWAQRLTLISGGVPSGTMEFWFSNDQRSTWTSAFKISQYGTLLITARGILCTAFGAVAQYALVKLASNGVYTNFVAGDDLSLLEGVALISANDGAPLVVLMDDIPVSMLSDGTTVFSVGDYVVPSSTVDGHVMSAGPSGSFGSIGKAQTAIAATLDLQVVVR